MNTAGGGAQGHQQWPPASAASHTPLLCAPTTYTHSHTHRLWSRFEDATVERAQAALLGMTSQLHQLSWQPKPVFLVPRRTQRPPRPFFWALDAYPTNISYNDILQTVRPGQNVSTSERYTADPCTTQGLGRANARPHNQKSMCNLGSPKASVVCGILRESVPRLPQVPKSTDAQVPDVKYAEQWIQLALCTQEFPTQDGKYCFLSAVS